MKKYLLLSLLSLGIILNSSLHAMEKASSSEAFLQGTKHSSFPSDEDNRGERELESEVINIDKRESKNSDSGNQLTLSLSAKKIRPMFHPLTSNVSKVSISYLDQKLPVPENFEVIMLYQDYYLKQLETSRETMRNELKKIGVNVIEPSDPSDENLSVILYSNKYNICFFITEDIRHFVIFSQKLLAQSSQKTKESVIVSNFITDLTETLNTPSMELLTTRQYMDFFDIARSETLGFSSPLKYLIHIYNKNLDFFDTISKAIGECEKVSSSRLKNLLNKEKQNLESYREKLEEQFKKEKQKLESYREKLEEQFKKDKESMESLRENLEEQLKEVKESIESLHEKLEEQLKKVKESIEILREKLEEAIQEEWLKRQRYVTLINEKLFTKQCSLIYNNLIEKKIFEDVLKKDYQKDVVINSGLYDLTLGWGDLSNSLRLTCCLGAGEYRQEGEAFYENFIFPFIDSLFKDLQKNYLNFNTFFKDKFKVTTDETKRLIVVKFNVEGVNKTPGFALLGFKPTSQNLPAIESTPQNVVARKQNCILM